MITIVFALVASLNALAVIVSLQLSERDRRASRLKGLALRPNCLLTRHPLVFLDGSASLFRLFDHWNNIPTFLREHGYEVLVLEPVALSGHSTGCAASLIAALDDLPIPAHLIADGASRAELEAIAERRHPRVKTLTLIENPKRDRIHPLSRRSSADALKPLASAVETFTPKSADARGSLRQWARRVLLKLHNVQAILRGRGTVDALEVGEFSESWEIETQFLDLAVQLAERDYREAAPLRTSPRAAAAAREIFA